MSGWTTVTENTKPAPAEGWTPVQETAAPTTTKAWDDPGSFIGNLINASGTRGLVELAKNPPKSWGDVFSAATGPAKQLAQTVSAPANILKDMIEAHQAGKHEEVLDHIGKLADSFIPGTQNAYELSKQTLDDIQSGNYGGLAGTAGGLGIQLALARSALKEPTAVPSRTAAKLYQSALKPPPGSYSSAEVAGMVKTGLENKIPISPGGIDKLNGLVADLHKAVQAEIDAGNAAGKTINKYAVTGRLSQMANKFATQVNPEADLAAIGESGNEFLRNQPTDIPASQAQQLKVGTYQQLGNKAYGELKSATIESQKALARGIKEELEKQFPEIKNLNAQESKLYDLQEPLERAIRRIDNHDIISLGSKVAGGAGAVIGGAGGAVAGTMMEKALGMPLVKSQLAIAINTASKGKISYPAAMARVTAYAAQLANVSQKSEQ